MSEGEQPLHSERMGLETNSNGRVYKQRKGHSNEKREIAMTIGVLAMVLASPKLVKSTRF